MPSEANAGGQRLLEQPLPQRTDGQDVDSKDDSAGCCPLRLDATAAISFVVVICGIGISILAFGPKRLLGILLAWVPAKPGWDWYCCLGALTTVSIVTLMPIWPPLCMAAGLLFGIVDGMVLNFFSIVSSVCISILLGRYFFREPIRRYVEDSEMERVRRILHVMEDSENALQFQVLFRFLFIPMFVRNYVPSILDVPAWHLIVGSLPHSAWISFLFASLGSSFSGIADLIRRGQEVDVLSNMRWQQLLLFVAGIAVAVFLAIYAHSKYTAQLERDEARQLRPRRGDASRENCREPQPSSQGEAA